MQSVENRYNIVSKLLCRVSVRWRRRLTRSTPCDPVHMKLLRKFGGKTCIYMSGVSSASKQDKVASRTAPVEHFEFHIRSDRDEALRGVTCVRGSLLRKARKRQGETEN